MFERPKRILVFHDSPGFGGHELAFLRILPSLLRSNRISELRFSFFELNARFEEVLKSFAHSKLSLVPGPYRSMRASSVTAPFRLAYRSYVRRCYRQMQPDTVLLLQGRIEAATVPMMALPLSADVVSYIPMAHTASDVGVAEMRGYMNDLVRRPYYRRPQRFITPSMAGADQLRRAGAIGEIYVVPNIVLTHSVQDKRHIRALFRIPEHKKLALFLGRFDVWQKGIDTLLAAIEQDASNLSDWHFLFVGEGDGETIISSTLSRLSPDQGNIHPWTNRSGDILASSNVVLMPSRFEGVPLSMLEALSGGVPVLASDIDVFREYLPNFCRWDFQTSPALGERLDALAGGSGQKAYKAHAAAISSKHSSRNSAELFEQALLGLSSDTVSADRDVAFVRQII